MTRTIRVFQKTLVAAVEVEVERLFPAAQLSAVGMEVGMEVVPPNPESNAGFTVTETDGGTSVTESGNSDTISIVLDEEPTADVTISLGAVPSDQISSSLSTDLHSKQLGLSPDCHHQCNRRWQPWGCDHQVERLCQWI